MVINPSPLAGASLPALEKLRNDYCKQLESERPRTLFESLGIVTFELYMRKKQEPEMELNNDHEEIAEATIRQAENGCMGYLALVKAFEEECGIAAFPHEYEQRWLEWLEKRLGAES